MSLTLQQIHNDRELIFSTSNKTLRSAIEGQTADAVKNFLEHISENAWLKEHQGTQLTSLILKVTATIPPETSDDIINLFMNAITELNPPEPEFNIGDFIFMENRGLAEKMFLNTYKYKYTGAPVGPPKSDEEKKLCMLDVALSNKALKAADLLFTEDLSIVDVTPHKHDLLFIVCDKGSIKGIEKAFDTVKKEKGSEGLKKYLENRENTIARFLHESSLDDIRRLVEIYKKFELDPASFIFTEGGDDGLSKCFKLEKLNLLLDILTFEKKKEALEKRGGALALNMLRDEAKNLDSFLEMMKNYGISQTSIFLYRDDINNLSVLDQACLYGQVEHVEILLKYLDDKNLSTLLVTPNYGFRTPLKHCTYDLRNSGCKELIEKEMVRLGVDYFT